MKSKFIQFVLKNSIVLNFQRHSWVFPHSTNCFSHWDIILHALLGFTWNTQKKFQFSSVIGHFLSFCWKSPLLSCTLTLSSLSLLQTSTQHRVLNIFYLQPEYIDRCLMPEFLALLMKIEYISIMILFLYSKKKVSSFPSYANEWN